MTLPVLSPTRALTLVVGVVVVACGAAALLQPAPPGVATVTASPVEAAVLGCPRTYTGGSSTTTASVVTAASTLTDDSVGVSGQALLRPLKGATEALVSVDSAPEVGTVRAESATSFALEASAFGGLAPYLGAGLVTSSPTGSTRGLMAVACSAPSSDAWFVGGAGTVGRRSSLWLTNTDSSPALVDIEIYGPSGRVGGGRGEGIEVAPNGQRALRLDVLVPGVRRAAVHVVARAGRVSSALRDNNTLGLIPRGVDFVPLSAAPSTEVVLPGVRGGTTGSRMLHVLAPGSANAIVEVRIVASDGIFAPDSAAVLEVPAGAVKQVDLARYFDGAGASAIWLSSDTPIVAGLRTVVPLGQRRTETANTSGTPALSGPTGFGPVRADNSHQASVSVTALDTAGLVSVTTVTPEGETATKSFEIRDQSTRRIDLEGLPPGSAVIVVPLAESGPVFAAVQLTNSRTDGAVITTVPLVTATAVVSIPPVRPDPATGVPGH